MNRPARELHAALDLFDRQLLDRHGKPCGNVDDVELEFGPDNQLYVKALLTGPGILARRLGLRRFGRWRQAATHRLHAPPDQSPSNDIDERSRVPIALAYEIGPAIRVACDATDLATDDFERWARDHFIAHIPGGRRAPE